MTEDMKDVEDVPLNFGPFILKVLGFTVIFAFFFASLMGTIFAFDKHNTYFLRVSNRKMYNVLFASLLTVISVGFLVLYGRWFMTSTQR